MRIRHFAAVVGAALAIAAVPAGAALASPTGGHGPAPMPTVSNPVHNPRPQPKQPEQFSVQRSVIGAVTVNDVEAAGPVAITGGTDTVLTAIRDEFTKGTAAVQVRHTGSPVVTADAAACTLTVTETGLWFLTGAAGADLHATGSGHYALAALFAFSEVPLYRHGPTVCPLAAISHHNGLDLVDGVTPYVSPSFSDVALHGAGTARI